MSALHVTWLKDAILPGFARVRELLINIDDEPLAWTIIALISDSESSLAAIGGTGSSDASPVASAVNNRPHRGVRPYIYSA